MASILVDEEDVEVDDGVLLMLGDDGWRTRRRTAGDAHWNSTTDGELDDAGWNSTMQKFVGIGWYRARGADGMGTVRG